MPKVVIDTNVYISAFNYGGAPLEVFVLGVRREIDIFISPSILKEIERVLLYDFDWPVNQVKETLSLIQRNSRLVDPQEKIDVIKGDEPDNRVLECAVEAKADVIVSGDKRHLLKLKTFRGVKIQTPSEFLESETWLPKDENPPEL